MDLVSSKLKDKRNRVLERETNELKDELCAMRHIVHLLDNIKRVSSDCIQFLHLMVDAAIRTDNNQLDQLRDDVQELEDELKTWERKYQLMASMQTMPALSDNNINNNLSNNSNKVNVNNETTTDDNEPNAGADECERFEVTTNGGNYYEDSDKNDDCAQSSSHNSMVLMPQELCEMSMETNDTDQIVITSGNTSPIQGSDLSLLPSGLQGLSSGKSLFECDWNGCDFRTNMRQRLVMHKRLHAGEMLFSCDVPGCGYQSNYKGNIKIHKKHRHRIDSDTDNKEYSLKEPTLRGENCLNSSSHSTPNLSHHLTKNNNFSSNMIRKRKRKKFRFTMNRSTVNKTVIGGQLVRDANDADPHSAKEEQMSSLFTCNVKGCNYRSKWKQCLTAHQLLHAGVKPFKCDHPGCNYRTNFKGNVNVHKRVHRESQYQCQVNGCHFSTPWKNSFNQHQRNHFINNTETTLNIDNHLEVFDESDENDFDGGLDEAEDEDDNSSDEHRTVRIVKPPAAKRKVLQTVLPVIPVRHKSTPIKLTATQLNSEMNSIQTNAQTLVPPMVGVIKTIKSEI